LNKDESAAVGYCLAMIADVEVWAWEPKLSRQGALAVRVRGRPISLQLQAGDVGRVKAAAECLCPSNNSIKLTACQQGCHVWQVVRWQAAAYLGR
jgi:hypothetical protein